MVPFCRTLDVRFRAVCDNHLVTDSSEASIVKILFIGSNPRVADLNELALDEEARDIENKMRAADYRDAFLFKSRWPVRPLDLQQILLEERPTVVQFSGHGAGAEGLVFHSEQADEDKTVSSQTLRDLFRDHGKGVRVVVLNACESDEQAKVLSDLLDFVVGMNDGIDDEAARVFAAAFYRGLGFGCTVKEAFDQGVLDLKLAEFERDSEVPILLVRQGISADETKLAATGGGR
ncbi:MAG: CHAT domain-containing protein [Planctomycetes bacterium]|nr:CHAT domain-containing protein [Planctomycetota bacterium]